MQKGFKQVNLEGCVSGTLAVPVIGENGNWFIGNDDTRVCATGAGGGGTHYSEDEQVIGTWVDGSVLYRKTINFGALPNNTTKQIDHNITNISRIVNLHGTAVFSDSSTMTLPYVNIANLVYCVNLNVDNASRINIVTGMDRSEATAYITLEYTKTSESV